MSGYEIRIPGRLYVNMRDLGLPEEALSQRVTAAYHAAVPVPKGRGRTYVITGPVVVLRGVLALVTNLVDEIDRGVLRSHGFGMELGELRRVSQQPIVRVRLTRRELEQRVRRAPVAGAPFNEHRRYPTPRREEEANRTGRRYHGG